MLLNEHPASRSPSKFQQHYSLGPIYYWRIVIARADAVTELRVAYAAALETEEAWAAIRDDKRFAQIIARVSGREEKE